MLEAKLVVVGGDAKSTEVRLKLPTIIGRGKEANLTVPHALVSRQHTELFEKDGHLFVKDLGSLNGTFVNNLKIEAETVLEPNQLLTLGNITFRAVYEIPASELDANVTPNSETISFDEVKTATDACDTPQVDVELEKKTSSPQIDFTETVPVDELKGKSKPEALAKSKPKPQSKPAAKSNPVPEPEPVAAAESIESVLHSETKQDDDGDTDKSFKTESEESISSEESSGEESISSIFAFEDEPGNAGKSVAISALDELPEAAPAAMSFVGKVDFGDDAAAEASQVDSIELDLGEEQKPKSQEGDSGLGSFLKKLPR